MNPHPGTETAERGKEEVFHPSSLYSNRQRAILLGALCAISVIAYLDRTILTVLLEPIRLEYGLSDSQLGLLTGAFALFYATLGLPIARWADHGNRKTIIMLAMGLWSVMTIVCGLVNSFTQLLIARVVVGGGESGAQPTGQSLIADYFPESQRGRALAIFSASASIGNLGGLMLGGVVVSALGWRWAFILAGLPGIVLVILSFFMLKEPRLDPRYVPLTHTHEVTWQALRSLYAKRSYRYAILALVCYFTVGVGAVSFIPTYVVRILQIDLATMGLSYGMINGVATLTGAISGGVVVDALRSRNPRWVFWFPAAGMLVSMALWFALFIMPTLITFLVFSFLVTFVLLAVSPAVFTALHAVCGSTRRTVAVAFAFFAGYLIGMGVGPTVIGMLSDHFAQQHGILGLRCALISIGILFLPATIFLLIASRHFIEDVEA